MKRLIAAKLAELHETVTLRREKGFDAAISIVLTGLQATEAIRRHEAGTGRHVPIIALTAHALVEDRSTFLAAGMDGFLTKPIRKHQLWNASDAMLTRKPAAPSLRRELVELDATTSDPGDVVPLATVDSDLLRDNYAKK